MPEKEKTEKEGRQSQNPPLIGMRLNHLHALPLVC